MNMQLPFFCTVCDKPINPSLKSKYATIHEECMKEYLDSFGSNNEFNKNINITDSPKK